MSRSAFGSTLVPSQTRRASFKLENEADADPSDAPSSPSTPSRRRSSSRGASKERRPSNPSPAKAMFQEVKSD